MDAANDAKDAKGAKDAKDAKDAKGAKGAKGAKDAKDDATHAGAGTDDRGDVDRDRPSTHAAAASIDVPGSGTVSALWRVPPAPRAVYVFAHGAGAGMDHPFMGALAQALAARSVATLRYQFPYMQRGSRRVDGPAVAHAAVRAAVAAAAAHLPGVPLFAGGKSFGGRMTSQAQAAAALPGVRGLAFVGFPLHPAGKPAVERATHLRDVSCPMLFLQGTRDELADLALLQTAVAPLQGRATLHVIEGADHGFHVRGRGGDASAIESLADAMTAWFAAQRNG